MKGNKYLVLYVIFMLLNIIDNLHILSINLFVKSLLMPFLILYVYQSKASNKLLISSLFFAWLGDIFLLNPTNRLLFIMGLSSFLIAHLFYIIIFTKQFKYYTHNCDKLINGLRIVILVIAIIFYKFIHIYFFSLIIPATIYMIVVLSMFISATFRNINDSVNSYYLVVIGALLFLLSDMLLSITQFYNHFYLDNLYIILTYMMAQLLIVCNIVKK